MSVADSPDKRAWVTPADLPPLTAGGRPLDQAQAAALLAALRAGKPTGLLERMRAQADPPSLAAFVRALYERWEQDGQPYAQIWALRALAWGDDAAALRLAALLEQRRLTDQTFVSAGLEVLAGMGHPAALRELQRLAQTPKLKGLSHSAAQALEQVAARRGLTRTQLEDRIIPDLGFDQCGRRALRCGAQSLQVILDDELRPLLRDPHGQLHTAVPPPASDAELAQTRLAIAEWRALKPELAEQARRQTQRLERAMVNGARWAQPDFEALFARHPLMTNLAQRLVWQVCQRPLTFRVCEDLSYADQHDRPVQLRPDDQIGLAHPLLLSPAERQTWGELLADYAIFQPFPQISREVFTLEARELDSSELGRFGSQEFDPRALLFDLERGGWMRERLDFGTLTGQIKHFEGFQITARIGYAPGIAVRELDQAPPQRLRRCFFTAGLCAPTENMLGRVALPLAQVAPLVLSEVIRDLSIASAPKNR